jgi:hypothetical protein
MHLNWMHRLRSMKVNKVEVVIKVLMHVINGFYILSAQALINTVHQVFLVKLGSVDLRDLLPDLLVSFVCALALHLGRLVLGPLLHLHLGQLEAVRLSLLVQQECLIQTLQVVKHQLVEAQVAAADKQVKLRTVIGKWLS